MAPHKILFLFLVFRCAASQFSEFHHSCSTNINFNANSSFQFHRATLFSSFTSANTKFYNTTIHSGGGETVYGLFMCRGDINLDVCHQCIINATHQLPSKCQFSKEVVIWYEYCMIRYSNNSFFSIVDPQPTFITMLNHFIGHVNINMMDNYMNIISEAVNDAAITVLRYATKSNIDNITVYSLAQCTQDLSPNDCLSCLTALTSNHSFCCENKIGGRALNPSCHVRYELYPFYNNSPPTAPPPAVAFSPKARTNVVVVVASLVVGGIILYSGYYLLKIQMKKSHMANLRQEYFGRESTTLEHLQFSLTTIEAATKNFSHENILGGGGFGQVFKGILSNGQEIAVKRLSKSSGQGAEEFKNEVLLIARLQHRNLVALLGFCIEEQEKLLVYEYVPNRSLDYFLFGSQNSRVLDWTERRKIIGGVARGILYLHEYSRLKIIHRDLKPSNILLDDQMNPKISDFGLAKLVSLSESEGSTKRIVGTYGYMSPEYAMYGQYSEKSDVFSFGVIVLEIISRKKNAGCHGSQYADGLLSYTWKKWRDDKLVEILDSNIDELGSNNEVIKCIQIGLLCVQENPNTRPSMATVVSYLSNDSIQLPLPQEPAFLLHGHQPQPIISKNGRGESCSVNEASMSDFFPR